MSEPIRAVAAHRGHGSIVIKVFSPTPENFVEYQVQIATDVGGPYSLYNNYQFFSDVGFLNDVPLEIVIYMQIRSVVAVDLEAIPGEWYQVRTGVLSKPSVVMKVKTIRDSRIGRGAAFPCSFRGFDLIAFQTPVDLILR